MEIVQAYPPNIEAIRKKFGEIPESVVFTYGNKLYNPSGGKIDPALLAHEECHSVQQEMMGKDDWWEHYLKNDDFRIRQEAEAYCAQLREARKKIKDKNKLNTYRHQLARDLSSSIYGNCISTYNALLLIK